MYKRHANEAIRSFIISNVEENPYSLARIVADKFEITRQSANLYLAEMVDEGILSAEGKTRNRKYFLRPFKKESFTLEITSKLEEDVVWIQYVRPLLVNIASNVIHICQYGFTEMFNNCIEHSEGTTSIIDFRHDAKNIRMAIYDNGIGIFNKVVRDLGLKDQRQAILELSKGKLTTDPVHHTGEGIFFTSRVFDTFSILSSNLCFSHDDGSGDWLIEDEDDSSGGTLVTMNINPNSDKNLPDLLDKFTASEEDYGFTRTHVPVSLARYGNENLVSRSQARRVLARFENFKEILLDFEGVDFIGQAFADEIFRVFKNAHPNINIIYVNANKNVEKMIKGALKASDNEHPVKE